MKFVVDPVNDLTKVFTVDVELVCSPSAKLRSGRSRWLLA